MNYHKYLITIFFIWLIWSWIKPHDYFTWILEVIPAIIWFIILALTYKKFKFSNFTYTLILIHCIILFIWWHYTYAEVPLFNFIRDFLWQDRNNYDKVWHFAQGFIPAAITFEILIRNKIIKKWIWEKIIPITICLSISAFYELIEWWVAIAWWGDADSFLWTQWYVWDTQSDMFYALIWSMIFIIFFSNILRKKL